VASGSLPESPSSPPINASSQARCAGENGGLRKGGGDVAHQHATATPSPPFGAEPLTAAALHAFRFAAGSVVRPLGSARICVEVTRTDDGLLRQIGYEDIREDKPAREIVRP
jgi:hypothetical protein